MENAITRVTQDLSFLSDSKLTLLAAVALRSHISVDVTSTLDHVDISFTEIHTQITDEYGT